MRDDARPADVLSGPGHCPRTGLVPRTRPTREGIERAPGSTTASGDLMRLFVAIAPPSAVLDELDTEVEPFRARRLDLRWTNREAWHVTLAFLGQAAAAPGARRPAASRDRARVRRRGRLPVGRAGERALERDIR